MAEDVVLREIAGVVWLPGDERYKAAPRVPSEVALSALGLDLRETESAGGGILKRHG
jgi:hypothetical protein